MWPQAAEAAQSGDSLLVAVVGLAGLVVTGVAGVVVAIINRTAQAAEMGGAEPPPISDPEITVRERIRVLEFRADEDDERAEIIDRRLDQIERRLDLDDPRWRQTV